ncbi:MAG: 30S ribosomal protein S19e [Halobacteriaceae archaeon]
MPTHYDAPTDELLSALAEELATRDAIEAPEWVTYAKTGPGRELPPQQEDFWERRCGSLLRKVAIDGPVGVGALETEYGGVSSGSTRYRVAAEHATDGSGKIIRTALQQLEEVGLVSTAKGEGRRITPDGQSLLDRTAGEVLEELDEPALDRYA